MSEGDKGTWSYCGNPHAHPSHFHTVYVNEGQISDVLCNGYMLSVIDAAYIEGMTLAQVRAIAQMNVRQTKKNDWKDINPYIAGYHPWTIGDVLICKKYIRFFNDIDYENTVDILPGDLLEIADYTTVYLLDFPTVKDYFHKPKRILQEEK